MNGISFVGTALFALFVTKSLHNHTVWYNFAEENQRAV